MVLPVQFRTVTEGLLSGRFDLAVTVADELPAGMRRLPLLTGGFLCLFDPRCVRLPKRLSVERYLAEEHVIVSYNGDLRGIVEDLLGLHRRVRISIPSFQSVAAAVSGTTLLATVPEIVTRDVRKTHPWLATCELPFKLEGSPLELVWRGTQDNAGALRLVREHIAQIASRLGKAKA